MCINPSHVWVLRGPEWQQEPVACRQCWRCRQNRVNDYVGRALCEAATSEQTVTLTLTYAPRDDLADKILHPRHFQNFVKLLRWAGHKIRYLVAGEYGDLKGRAHFHAILFIQSFAPRAPQAACYNPGHIADPETSAPFSREVPHKRICHIREWPHGHVTADWAADEKAIRYVCKYLLTENKNNAWFSLSKKPALGAAWFAQKAERARELGVLPSSFEYMPPGGTKGRPYMMSGATRRDYLNAITQDPAMRARMSEWVLKTFDKHARARWQAELDAQPLEALQSMFEQRIAERERQRAEEYRRATADLGELLKESADGILRREAGRWVPTWHERETGDESH